MIAHKAQEPLVQSLLLPNRLLNGHPKIQATAAKLSTGGGTAGYATISARHPSKTAEYSTTAESNQPPPSTSYSDVMNLYTPMRTYRIQPIYAYNPSQYWNSHPDYALLGQQPAYKWSYLQNDFVASNVRIRFGGFLGKIF